MKLTRCLIFTICGLTLSGLLPAQGGWAIIEEPESCYQATAFDYLRCDQPPATLISAKEINSVVIESCIRKSYKLENSLGMNDEIRQLDSIRRTLGGEILKDGPSVYLLPVEGEITGIRDATILGINSDLCLLSRSRGDVKVVSATLIDSRFVGFLPPIWFVWDPGKSGQFLYLTMGMNGSGYKDQDIVLARIDRKKKSIEFRDHVNDMGTWTPRRDTDGHFLFDFTPDNHVFYVCVRGIDSFHPEGLTDEQSNAIMEEECGAPDEPEVFIINNGKFEKASPAAAEAKTPQPNADESAMAITTNEITAELIDACRNQALGQFFQGSTYLPDTTPASEYLKVLREKQIWSRSQSQAPFLLAVPYSINSVVMPSILSVGNSMCLIGRAGAALKISSGFTLYRGDHPPSWFAWDRGKTARYRYLIIFPETNDVIASRGLDLYRIDLSDGKFVWLDSLGVDGQWLLNGSKNGHALIVNDPQTTQEWNLSHCFRTNCSLNPDDDCVKECESFNQPGNISQIIIDHNHLVEVDLVTGQKRSDGLWNYSKLPVKAPPEKP